MDLVYKILIYPSSKVIKYVQEVFNGVIINNIPPFIFINCVIYVKSKITHIILRRINSEEAFFKAETVFFYNIIYKKKAYNRNIFYLYLQDLYISFNIVYIYRSISDSFLIINTIFIQIRNIYKYKLKVLYLNNEKTLENEYKILIIKLGIREKRLVPKTYKQPKSKRAERLLTIKVKSIIIKVNISDFIQNKVYKIAGYIVNKTPIKRLR